MSDYRHSRILIMLLISKGGSAKLLLISKGWQATLRIDVFNAMIDRMREMECPGCPGISREDYVLP
jgi:hypothetical protein